MKPLSRIIATSTLALTFSWFFLANNPNGGLAQIGPFKDQQSCEAYRANLNDLSLQSLACFSSTAK